MASVRNYSKITSHSTCGQPGQETNLRKTSVLREVGTRINNRVQNRLISTKTSSLTGERLSHPGGRRGGSFSRHTEGSIANARSQSQPLQCWLAALAKLSSLSGFNLLMANGGNIKDSTTAGARWREAGDAAPRTCRQ